VRNRQQRGDGGFARGAQVERRLAQRAHRARVPAHVREARTRAADTERRADAERHVTRLRALGPDRGALERVSVRLDPVAVIRGRRIARAALRQRQPAAMAVTCGRVEFVVALWLCSQCLKAIVHRQVAACPASLAFVAVELLFKNVAHSECVMVAQSHSILAWTQVALSCATRQLCQSRQLYGCMSVFTEPAATQSIENSSGAAAA